MPKRLTQRAKWQQRKTKLQVATFVWYNPQRTEIVAPDNQKRIDFT